jgi:hypothetical protein
VPHHQTVTTDTMIPSRFNPALPHNRAPRFAVTLLFLTPAIIDIIVNGVASLMNDSLLAFLRIGIIEQADREFHLPPTTANISKTVTTDATHRTRHSVRPFNVDAIRKMRTTVTIARELDPLSNLLIGHDSGAHRLRSTVHRFPFAGVRCRLGASHVRPTLTAYTATAQSQTTRTRKSQIPPMEGEKGEAPSSHAKRTRSKPRANSSFSCCADCRDWCGRRGRRGRRGRPGCSGWAAWIGYSRHTVSGLYRGHTVSGLYRAHTVSGLF